MGPRKVLLFGGTGFVGSRVLRDARRRGWRVVCATRGGVPLVDDVAGPTFPPPEFVSLDATSRSQVAQFVQDHPDAAAVVSCVGRLTRNHAEARRVCGDANVNIAAAVYEHGRAVRRVVLVSAEPCHESLPLLGSGWLWKGYFHGKRMAERAVLENLAGRGVVLRPGFIYGTRHVAVGDGCIPLPLWLLGRPLEVALRPLHRRGVLLPPVSVDVVAAAIVHSMEVSDFSGIVDYYDMQKAAAAAERTGRE